MTHAADIQAALSKRRFNFANEAELQRGVEAVLREDGIAFEREVILSERDRIDFLCGRIGVEVKIDHPTAALIRQLLRYAEHDRIDELFVVTSRSRLTVLPATLGGKPVTCFLLGGRL